MRTYTVGDICYEILTQGRVSTPRNKEIIELTYFQGEILNPWSLYPSRKYPVDYYKREMQWYLHADPYDKRICDHAKMWTKLIQEDGSILSNYGVYWFNKNNRTPTGFKWVVDTLTEDPNSRQAYIAMNDKSHAFPGNKDVVCTKGIQFRIIDGNLWCHVAMRSSDVIFGLGTDLPCFWTLWVMVARALNIELGTFILSADSVHVYEEHYEMAKNMTRDDLNKDDNIPEDIPYLDNPYDLIDEKYESEFGKWLTSVHL